MKRDLSQGHAMTREAILLGMEKFDTDFRASFPERKWKRYAVVYDERQYPPKELMRIVTGQRSVPSGGEAVNRYYKRLGFQVINRFEIDEQNGDDEVEEVIETSLSLERDLEDSLVRSLDQLEAGLELYIDDGVTGRQVATGAVGRIDLLALSKAGELVVIELKAGEADDKVCGQILGYMSWVDEALAKGRQVRGIVVANEFTAKLKYAVRQVPKLSLTKYEVSFKFSSMEV